MFPSPQRTMVRTALTLFGVLAMATVAAAQPSDSRLKRIEGTKTVKIAHRLDAQPFSFVSERREPAGYTIDLCKLVVKSIAQQLGASLEIVWVPVTTQDRFDAVAGGLADMECGSTTVSLGRMNIVDFSSFIFVENTALAVTAASGIRALEALAGKKIAVIAGTTNERALARELQRRRLTATVIQVANRDEGMAALGGGAVDAFASDRFLLGSRIDKSFAMLPEDISVEPYAIVLPRGDWAFRLAVNTALAQVFRSGDVLDVYTNWFSNVASRPNALIGAVYVLGALPQ
jgi:glutamate/aspartate transport system substrate-binding protein